MKRAISALVLLALVAMLAVPGLCETTAVRVGALTGPTAMGMAQLLNQPEYTPTIVGAADELMPRILQGEVDIAAVPANLAATLYQKTQGGVTVLAVNVLGVLYVGELGGETVQTVADLKGKTLLATGKGATPEYFLRYILTQNGLDPDKDVAIQWKSEPSEVVALLNAKGEGLAMLPQPYVTAAANQLGENFRIALSVSEEWEKLESDSLCTTAVVLAQTAFVQEHPEQVQAFLEALSQSVQWVNDQPQEAAELCEQLGIIKAGVAKKAIPGCNLVCITGDEMKQALSGCLEVIYDQNPKAVGGKLPGNDFYYGAE